VAATRRVVTAGQATGQETAQAMTQGAARKRARQRLRKRARKRARRPKKERHSPTVPNRRGQGPLRARKRPKTSHSASSGTRFQPRDCDDSEYEASAGTGADVKGALVKRPGAVLHELILCFSRILTLRPTDPLPFVPVGRLGAAVAALARELPLTQLKAGSTWASQFMSLLWCYWEAAGITYKPCNT